jgi:hypothetical protein
MVRPGVLASVGALAGMLLHKARMARKDAKMPDLVPEAPCATCARLAGWEEGAHSGCYVYTSAALQPPVYATLCSLMAPLYPITPMNATVTDMDKIHPCADVLRLLWALVTAELPLPTAVSRAVLAHCRAVVGQPESRAVFLAETALLLPCVADRVTRRLTAMTSMHTAVPVVYTLMHYGARGADPHGIVNIEPDARGKGHIVTLVTTRPETWTTFRTVARDADTGLAGVVTLRSNALHATDMEALQGTIGGVCIASRMAVELVRPRENSVLLATGDLQSHEWYEWTDA